MITHRAYYSFFQVPTLLRVLLLCSGMPRYLCFLIASLFLSGQSEKNDMLLVIINGKIVFDVQVIDEWLSSIGLGLLDKKE